MSQSLTADKIVFVFIKENVPMMKVYSESESLLAGIPSLNYILMNP